MNGLLRFNFRVKINFFIRKKLETEMLECDIQSVYGVCNYTCERSFTRKDVVGFYADRALWKCCLKLVGQTDA